jgi:hypothetical protein
MAGLRPPTGWFAGEHAGKVFRTAVGIDSVVVDFLALTICKECR